MHYKYAIISLKSSRKESCSRCRAVLALRHGFRTQNYARIWLKCPSFNHVFFTLYLFCVFFQLFTYEVNNFPRYNITQCVHASWYKASTWRRVNYFLSVIFFYVAPVAIIIASYAIIIRTLRRWKSKNLHGNNRKFFLLFQKVIFLVNV